jgi:APA family basic amino acid/polyamine antiporter
MLVMGGIVGSGIFMNPYVVAQRVHTPALIMAAWILGGLVGVGGAFIWAELAATLPAVGGQYAYLREAYHPAVAFLYGWVLLLVIQTGGMAVVSITFARYFVELTGLHAREWMVAAAALAALTLVNCFGVKTGGRTQSALMVMKIAAICALVIAGLVLTGRHVTVTTAAERDWSLTSFGAAMVPVLFAYGGWQTANFLAAEVKEPKKNLPRGLLFGVLGVVVLYMGVNWVCLRSLGPRGTGRNHHPRHRGDAYGIGPTGCDVYCGGNRHFHAGVSQPVDLDRTSRVLCDGR